MRAKVEHVFGVIKGVFGFRKAPRVRIVGTIFLLTLMARQRNLWVDTDLFALFLLLKESIELSAGCVESTLCGLGDTRPDQWPSLFLDKAR